MSFTRSLCIFGVFLWMVTLISACGQRPSDHQQGIPTFTQGQPVEMDSQPPKPSPLPGQLEATWTFIPLPTQPVSVIEVTKEAAMTTPVPQPTPRSPGEAELIRLAMQDLAGRLDISLESIELVQFETVVWPDGSLGCPQPGVEYPQVQSEGYRIQLRLSDRLYNYHGGGNRPPFLCETMGP